MSEEFEKGQAVDIFVDGIKTCSGFIKDVDMFGVIIQEAGLPIKYVGKDVEIKNNCNKMTGVALAWGKGCIDKKTDLLTVVSITDNSTKPTDVLAALTEEGVSCKEASNLIDDFMAETKEIIDSLK